MDQFLTVAAEAVTQPIVVYSLAGGILVAAFVFWLFFFFRTRSVRRGLKRATSIITQHDSEEAFANNYESVRQELRTNTTISHSWSEFEEVLLPDPSAEPPVVRNTRSPGEYFSRNSVIAERVNLRLYNALPNLLTGFGILGTFIGLVAGIHLAGQGLGSADPTEVQNALQNLLNGASLAFTTSIAGLIASIFFNVAEKRGVHSLDNLLADWVTALDARLERVTVESLASRQLEQSRQQTLVLESFSSELAFQIADEIGKKFNADLSPTLEKLVDAVEGMRDQRKDDTGEMIGRMVGEFQESLTGSAGQELQALGDAVGTVTRELREASSETSTQLAQMADRLKATVNDINHIMDRANETATQHEQIVGANRDIIDALGEAGGRFGKLAEPIEQSASAISQSAKSLEQTMSGITESHTQIQQTVSEISQLQERLTATWESYEQRFGEVDR
ncbi:hypothetical protein RM531_15950 [Salinisphaera sp. P385]|uniref:MotA/TolQ/ExbB proton channel family protein n=1 Tax=Spectribacter acetivorans TaxID=3075603 RepID=A0ABU3BBX1_9GAMM|nr:hypothetical protein [Salinisphaera sp. P385]MDT0619962.1 hypothetical protein [Salinisphaera sp. P385]